MKRRAWIEYRGNGVYRVYWWPRDAVRSPNAKMRETDREGANRFAKRHKIPPFPEFPKEGGT